MKRTPLMNMARLRVSKNNIVLPDWFRLAIVSGSAILFNGVMLNQIVGS